MSESWRECVHKEILLSRFIIRIDDMSADHQPLEFAMCKNCWNRIKHLRGFTLIEQSHRPLKTRNEINKELSKIPF